MKNFTYLFVALSLLLCYSCQKQDYIEDDLLTISHVEKKKVEKYKHVYKELNKLHFQLTKNDLKHFNKIINKHKDSYSNDLIADRLLVIDQFSLSNGMINSLNEMRFDLQNILEDEDAQMAIALIGIEEAKKEKKGILGSLGSLFNAGPCVSSTLNMIDTIIHFGIAVGTSPTGVGAVINAGAGITSYGLAVKQGKECVS